MSPERAHQLLGAERTRIELEFASLAHSDASEPPEDEFDPANRAAELYEDELDASRVNELREQLAALERAESRLAAGTYGYSVVSGEPIPDERLEVVPTTELTVDEQRAQDRR